jgi:ABC-type transport system substrate-binding protein
MKGFKALLLVSAASFAGFESGSAAAENVVRWATPTPAETFDPYGHDTLQTIWVQNLVFESLTNYDRQGWLEPGLAVSWKQLDAQTWAGAAAGDHVS